MEVKLGAQVKNYNLVKFIPEHFIVQWSGQNQSCILSTKAGEKQETESDQSSFLFSAEHEKLVNQDKQLQLVTIQTNSYCENNTSNRME